MAIDERQWFVTFVQTGAGKLLLFMIALLAVAPHFSFWPALLATGAAMAMGLQAKRRSRILFAATWSSAILTTMLGENDTLDNLLDVMAQERAIGMPAEALAIGWLALLALMIAAALYWARRAPHSILARRPLVILLLLLAVLCAAANSELSQGRVRVVLWAGIFVFTPYLWFLPFAVMDMRGRQGEPLMHQMGMLRPFWSPTYLPFGKGAAFLRKHVATSPAELAVTHLKAVKLLCWANVLYGLRSALDWVCMERLHIPSMPAALEAFGAGRAYPVAVAWAAVILSTARYGLKVAYWAHLFIGIARLAGYRLPRGSWRPLEAQTLIEYFNRFHYYFKELLVDLFFIPTFFKVFKQHPRMRMFFATFMAAGVGNALWHFIRDINVVATQGVVFAFSSFTSYLFYCLILATGVGLSQLRANAGFRPSLKWHGRVLSFLTVWGFVVCMHVFSDESRSQSLEQRLRFMASLWGVLEWI